MVPDFLTTLPRSGGLIPGGVGRRYTMRLGLAVKRAQVLKSRQRYQVYGLRGDCWIIASA